MTGADLCRSVTSLEVRCALANEYRPGDMLITLTPHNYGGHSAKNLTLAAHECGHAFQPAWLQPLRWLVIGRLALEWDASRRARAVLTSRGLVVDEAALRASWHGYVWPAAWQTGAMAGVLGFLLWRKL